MDFPALSAVGASGKWVHADRRPSRDSVTKLTCSSQHSEAALRVELQTTGSRNAASRGRQREWRSGDRGFFPFSNELRRNIYTARRAALTIFSVRHIEHAIA